MLLKDNLLTIQNLQTACFYHKHFKSYSLTNKPTDQPHIEAAEVIGGS